MPVLLGFTMLVVDAGRTSMTRYELQAAADAAARYAAAGAASSSTKAVTAYAQAQVSVADQKVDGRAITLSASQVELGIWTPATRKFVANTSSSANAVRVTLRQTLGAQGSLPLFAAMFGQPTRQITAVSVASATVNSVTVTVPASGNLWLSGASNNTQITNNQSDATKYDNSGNGSNAKQRPMEFDLDDLGMNPGDVVSFEGLDGVGNNGAGATDTGPDGNTSRVVSLGVDNSTGVPTTGANGIANTRAPLAASMAVFMSNAPPNSGTQPAGLDFGTAASRDYTLLNPSLKQPFFVGDGKTSGGEVQQIRIPAGAKRIFLGMMDAWQWNDNTGSFTLKFYRATTVSTVK